MDLSNVELILTTSMVKLWDSYASCEDYLRNCKENGYTFGITKSCPKVLENERSTNYQFLQVYDLDPFVTKKIYGMIKKRIIDAKIGVIKVRGNYSIISGDPYALCQSIFGLEVTGLLKAGEIYNKYWLDHGVDNVVCFRAPMTCANNVIKMHVNGSEEVQIYGVMFAAECLGHHGGCAERRGQRR